MRESASMVLMCSTESSRKQYLDRIAFKMSPGETEHCFGLRVCKYDPAIMIDDDHGVGSCIQEGAEISFEPIRKTD